MGKRLMRSADGFGTGRLSVLICLTACFAAGIMAGCFFAGILGADAQNHLSAYLNDYFTVLRDGEIVLPSLFSTVWELARWIVLVFALGLTALGVIGIPAVFLLRGFLLSYAVAVFVRLYGSMGLLAALAVFGASGIFVLPAFFILGVDGFESAKNMAGVFLGGGKGGFSFPDGYFRRAAGCCVLLAVSTAVQFGLTPLLMRAIAQLMAG